MKASGSVPALLWAFTGLSLLLSLGVRIAVRGHDSPGWDFLGPAHGLYVLSARPPFEALAELMQSAHRFGYWNHTDSLLYTLLPGLLTKLVPWPYWGHVLTLALVLASLGLVARLAGLPPGRWFVPLLAWGASPALLSFSLAGYPYATGFLPHALALLIVTSPRLRASPAGSFLASLLACAASWHLYELGKTLVSVFVIAAIVEKGAPARTRAAWLLASALQLLGLAANPGRNLAVLTGEALQPRDVTASISQLASALVQARLDLPVLLATAALALACCRRQRALLAGGLAVQLALVVLLAGTRGDELRPRRFLNVTFYCIASLTVAYAASLAQGAGGRRLRAAICAALVGANLWQLGSLLGFAREGVRDGGEPLPYTAAPDYTVACAAGDFARHVQGEIDRGRSVVLVYNLSAAAENMRDPAAVLERVYLGVGHERFVAAVAAFGWQRCRYDCLPITRLNKVDAAVEVLATAGGLAPDGYFASDMRSARYVEESATILKALRTRFDLEPQAGPVPGFGGFRLVRRSRGRTDFEGFVVEGDVARLRDDMAWAPDAPAEAVHTEATGGTAPIEQRFGGSLIACDEAPLELLVGASGELSVSVDGREVLHRRGSAFGLERRRLELARGRHALAVHFKAARGRGRVFVDFQRPGVAVPRAACPIA